MGREGAAGFTAHHPPPIYVRPPEFFYARERGCMRPQATLYACGLQVMLSACGLEVGCVHAALSMRPLFIFFKDRIP